MTRAALLGVGAVTAGQILAACGDDDDAAEAPATTAAPDTATTEAPATTAAPEPTGPKVGGTFREGYDRDLTGPDTVSSAWADPTFNAFHEAVAIRDPEGVLVPMMCSEFVSSDTGWEFTLREGLKFHHGDDVTPEMIVENFNLFRDPATGVNAVFWAPITDVTSEGNIIRCHTDGPFAAFQETVSTEYSYILNTATRDEHGDEYGAAIVDGTGPFRMTAFDTRQGAVGTRCDDYPGSVVPFFANKGTAYLDTVELIPIPESAQRRNEIETGNVDAIKNPPPQDVEALSNNEDLVVQEFQELSNFFLSLNIGATQHGFDDLRVRQAISLAIDTEFMEDVQYDGLAKSNALQVWTFVFDDEPSAAAGDYGRWHGRHDIDEAKKLIAAAGAEGLEFENFYHNYGSPTGDQRSDIVKEQLAAVGLTLNPRHVDYTEFNSTWVPGKLEEASTSAWATVGFDADNYFYSVLHSQSSGNRWQLNDPQVDALAEAQQVELDPDARRDILREIWDYVMDKAYHPPLPTQFSFEVYQPWVRGLRFGGVMYSNGSYYDWGHQMGTAWLDK